MVEVRIRRFFLVTVCCLGIHCPHEFIAALSAADDFATLKDFVDDQSPPESDGIYRSTAPRELFEDSVAPRRSGAPSPNSDLSATDPTQTPALPSDENIKQRHRRERKDRLGDRYNGRTAPNLLALSTESYRVYRSAEAGWLYMPTDELGWTSLFNSAYLPRTASTNPKSIEFDFDASSDDSPANVSHEFQSNFSGAFNIHWLNGPSSVPLPPRLYDLSLGYQLRDDVNEYFSYDMSASIGLYTDFEDSVREGLRFPAHAAGILHVNQQLDFVFGADFTDRDDIKCLPVIGFSLYNTSVRGLRMDLIFPRPRIEYAWDPNWRAYVRGQLGGGTWDIELPDSSEDVMTLREYHLALGFENARDDGSTAAIELGWVLNRTLETRSLPGSLELADTLMLQYIHRQ